MSLRGASCASLISASHDWTIRSIGEVLKGSKYEGLWKYRVGDYRIIAHIDDGAICILVVRIGNRRDVYRRDLGLK